MAENIKREGARLRDYFGRETLRGLLATAEKDPDRVSVMRLGNDGAVDGAIVVIKGWQEYEMFRQWAVRQRLLSTGAPPPSGCQAARDGDPLDCEET